MISVVAGGVCACGYGGGHVVYAHVLTLRTFPECSANYVLCLTCYLQAPLDRQEFRMLHVLSHLDSQARDKHKWTYL